MKSSLNAVSIRFIRKSLGGVATQSNLDQIRVAGVNSRNIRCGNRIPSCRLLSTREFHEKVTQNQNPGKAGSNDVLDDQGDEYYDEEEDMNYEEYENYEDDYDDDFDDEHDFGSRRERKKTQKDRNRRIWLDPSLSAKDRVNRFVNRGIGELHPLDVTLASVDLIRECCKMKSFEGMKYAHDILDRILEEKRHVNATQTKSHVFISERPFKVLMYGWSNLARRVKGAPEQMREILDLMIQEAEYDEEFQAANVPDPEDERRKVSERKNAYEGLSCRPTVDIYNTLLQGLEQASYRSFAAAGEAETLLTKMNRMHKNRGWHTKPNTKSFSLVLAAFSRTGHIKSGDRAEAVLRRMINFHAKEKEAYEKETNLTYDESKSADNKRRIVTPDTIAYSTVIQAHAKSNAKGAAEKALALLTELIQSDSPSLRPDSFAFANTINAFASLAGREKTDEARTKAAENAEGILWAMVDECKKTGETGFEASVVPFNACLHAWAQANTPDSPIRAEELLHKMLDPELQEVTRVYPNANTFNTCMQAWAKTARVDPNAPTRTEEVLSLLMESETIEANTQSFAIVMNAYAQSNLPDKASQAKRVLQVLTTSRDEVAGKVTAVPFTVVLNAVAHSPRISDVLEDDDGFGGGMPEDPYSVALDTYTDLRDDIFDLGVEPDHFVFATMLDVVRQHTDVDSIERRQRLETIFADACATGQVSSLVLEALFKACPSSGLLQELLQTNDPPSSIKTINGFPAAWIHNVPPKFRRLRSNDNERQKRRPKRGNKKRKV